jgi:hypothetical protein
VRKIFKYPISMADRFKVDMPGLVVLVVHVDLQNDRPFFWAEVHEGAPMQERTFAVIGTGHPLTVNDGEVLSHRGTWQDGVFVWHLYELIERVG